MNKSAHINTNRRQRWLGSVERADRKPGELIMEAVELRAVGSPENAEENGALESALSSLWKNDDNWERISEIILGF